MLVCRAASGLMTSSTSCSSSLTVTIHKSMVQSQCSGGFVLAEIPSWVQCTPFMWSFESSRSYCNSITLHWHVGNMLVLVLDICTLSMVERPQHSAVSTISIVYYVLLRFPSKKLTPHLSVQYTSLGCITLHCCAAP